MKKAKIFQSGGSKAVRIPKKFLKEDEYLITFQQGIIMLIPKQDKWKLFLEGLSEFSDDFLNDRKEPSIQERNFLN